MTSDQDKEEAGDDDTGGFKVKERSILQAKLTKLAIQIGYAGEIQSIFVIPLVTITFLI